MGLKGLGYFFREWDVWVKFEWLCSRYFFFFRLGVVWLAGKIKGFVNELFSLCFFAIAEVMIKVRMGWD